MMTKKIPLSHGRFAIIDDEYFETCGQMRWDFSEGYVWCRSAGNYTSIQNFIMNPPTGMVVDHINRDRLDNRCENLRVCTQKDNSRNRGKYFGEETRSIYKGVTRNLKNGQPYSRWIARLMADGKTHYSGRYNTQEEAARAYDDMARKYHGEHASLNFPD